MSSPPDDRSSDAPESPDSADADRDRRRAERAAWPIRRYRLGEEPADDLSATTTPSERLAMVWPLTVRAWRLAGREIPSYTRAETPGRIVRGDPAD